MEIKEAIKEATNKFYQVVISIEIEDEKGKIKHSKEIHLVDGIDPTDVQKKVIEQMNGTMFDWEITSITLSKIIIVY